MIDCLIAEISSLLFCERELAYQYGKIISCVDRGVSYVMCNMRAIC